MNSKQSNAIKPFYRAPQKNFLSGGPFREVFQNNMETFIAVCREGVLHLVWALYCIHIVLEVTMNVAEYTC